MAVAEQGPERFEGKRASGGLAAGPVFILTDRSAGRQTTAGSADEEKTKLRDAIAIATGALAELADVSGDMAAEILGFQIALLEDDALIDPALQQISTGATAQQAWRIALDAQVSDYANSEEPYFRARAEDLVDLRDRVEAELTEKGLGAVDIPDGSIVVATKLTPSRFLSVDWQKVRGLVLENGSPSSHVAMLARARGLPMAVGLGEEILRLVSGEQVVLDAEAGTVQRGLESDELKQIRRQIEDRARRSERQASLLPMPAITRSGAHVTVCINVDDPARLDSVPVNHCDGIGLTRTEFLFHDRASLPTEDEQVAVYRRILDWAQGRSVTIRTLDAGGDKPIAGLTVEDESNPFLGLRGLRLSLARPEIFDVQLRALARVSGFGPLQVMFPMVTVARELDQARSMFWGACAAVERAGHTVGTPSIGMMVEVPAAAIAIDQFDADFFSIGSNDLIQYVTATSRDGQYVTDLYDPLNPAILSLIRRVADHGRATGKPVSICGDMAAEDETLSALLDCGIRSISVADVALARAKALIAGYGTKP